MAKRPTKTNKFDRARALPVPAPEPYTPTEREKAAMASQEKRLASRRPAPRIRVVSRKGGVTALEAVHPDRALNEALVRESLGTSDSAFANVIVDQLAQLSQTADGKGIDEAKLNHHLAMVRAVAPGDEVETMLATQMAAIHCATMTMALRVQQSTNSDRRDANIGLLNKLGRTFTTQVEALKRYRSKGDQRVVVEHRHYHLAPGAQAVFGDVTSHEAGGENRNGRTTP